MATLILASRRAALGEELKHAATRNAKRLRDWLNGRWGILYSNPEDFAPHPSTPRGFIACMSGEFEQYEVKPITLGSERGAARESWLDVAVDDHSLVIVDPHPRDDRVIDFAERALAMRLARIVEPFVMILDAAGRCRSTITYRPRRIDRPRTLGDLLDAVAVLRR